MRSRAGMWAAAIAVAGALGTGGVAQADTITVNETGDGNGTCPDTCTLRAAVGAAQAGDTIEFTNPGTYRLTAGAPITISRNITITGAGTAETTIDGSANLDGGQNPHRIFMAQAPLQLSGVTLQGGNASGDDTCPSACSTLSLNGGGAIFSTATLRLDHVRFTGNRASVGGAVSSSGTLDMTDVEFAGDDAAFGGGLFVRGGTASGDGVSLHDLGSGAYGGGAVFLYGGTLSLTNSTITGSGWASSRGGGIENYGGTLTLNNDTLAGNARGALMTDQPATTVVGDTIIGAGFDDGGADYACVAAGRPTNSGPTTAAAITQDNGHNLDEDGHCGLTDPSDRTGDAHMAPLADNGGATPTMALLQGSPALDAIAFCEGADQRGVARPQPDGGQCDIGAFEAEQHGQPSATTDRATDIGSDSAALTATVALDGEAGGAYFDYGTSPDALDRHTAVAAAGASPTAALTLDGLQPSTTYYFRAVAINATGTGAGATLSFTTTAGRPQVYDIGSSDVTDTTAKIGFTVDPGGAHTTYVVRYGTDVLTRSTPPVDVPQDTGAQQLSATLTGLLPGTTYYYVVEATNSEGSSDSDGDSQLVTDRQVRGTPGTPLTVTDSGDFGACPSGTVDWGDRSDATHLDVDCHDDGEDGQAFDATAAHTYAADGHYRIILDYGEARTQEWAQVGGTGHTLSVTVSGPGSVTGEGIDCPDQCVADFPDGGDVTLTPANNDGATFEGWSGACSGTDVCTVPMDQDRDVTARFEGPPTISDGVGVDPVRDTDAQLHFTLDPNGSDTTYVIRYGTDTSYGQTLGPFDLGSTPGAQDLSPTLTGLLPNTTYHFDVVATNGGASPATVESGDEVFTTEPQVSALAGQPVSVHDAGFSDTSACPGATVDWGDGTSSAGDVTCVPHTGGGQDYALSASHAYAAAGHYPIQIAYDRGGNVGQLWALISAPQQATPTPTPTPSPTPTPTPTPTATPTPNPTPVFHQQVVVRPISGTVLVRKKGTNTFVPLDTKEGVPLGSQVDVTHGRIQLTSVPRRGGKPQSAQFYAGIFTVTQPGSITLLTLSGPKPTCATAKGKAASAAATKKKVRSRKLWGNGHGSFRTSGQYSAATVRGTQWLVEDTCAGTLTRVAHGLVAVNDRVRHKTVLVRGGKSYLARPRKP